jgi:nitrile hydratase
LERILAEKGRIRPAEIEARLRGLAAASEPPPLPERSNPTLAEGLAQAVYAGAPASRGRGKPRYRAGAAVRVLKMNPSGHTRCPRYVRGMRGTVEHVHEKFIFPDAHAHGRGERPEVLYTVGFEATELWGKNAEGRGRVYVDLWESYLEPGGPARTATANQRSRRRRAASKRKARRR